MLQKGKLVEFDTPDALVSKIEGKVFEMRTFTRAYNKATDLVKQYNRELDRWERKVSGESAEPIREDPPGRESVRQQLRELEAEAKGKNSQQKPQRRNRDMER